MKDVLATVEYLKDSAKDNRDFEDLDAALKDLKQAIDLLLPSYQSAKDPDYQLTLSQQIADCYGMMGGIYRRLAVTHLTNDKISDKYLGDAAKMYQLGVKYEDRSNASYNLSNSIVISILIDSGNLDQKKDVILEGTANVRVQVAGERKDQWWAWADLGLFRLLSGDKEEALHAYEQFKRVGAREEDYESTINVLSALWDKLRKAASPASRAIAQSVGDVIQILRQEI